jgi:hypothetical protein
MVSTFDAFDIGYTNDFEVILGNTTWIDTPIILKVFDQPLLRIDPPECPGAPFRLSAVFFDPSGKEIFTIEENEWRGYSKHWDIEIIVEELLSKTLLEKFY